MVSFIVTAKDKQKRIAYEKDYCAKQEINRFDITLTEKETTTKQNAQSIGIEDIKLIQKKIFLKPIKSKAKAVIIEDAHLLTPEAQNALLKVLEEPPADTIIILGSDTKEALLPTILSRCQIIALEEEQSRISEKEYESITSFINQLPNFTIGERLKKAEQLAKDKNETLAWIEKTILILRKFCLNVILVSDKEAHAKSTSSRPDSGVASLPRMTNYLRSFQTLHTLLKTTNTNPRFAIENTLLQLTSDQ